MTAKVFEAALGISAPWSAGAVEFDEAAKALTVPGDFKPDTRFKVSGHEGLHSVHNTVVKPLKCVCQGPCLRESPVPVHKDELGGVPRSSKLDTCPLDFGATV